MYLKKKIESKIDKVVKYVFEYRDGSIPYDVEFSYIDNGTEKDIICIPTQTMCNMSCSFCYLTKYVGKIATRTIEPTFIIGCIRIIVNDLKLDKDTILFSFMASGEPMGEPASRMIETMLWLRKEWSDNKNVRFAISTILPKNKKNYITLVQEIIDHKLDVKMHLSVHFVNDEVRRLQMPNAIGLKTAISFLDFYHRFSGNAVEIHYTLIKGLNDSTNDFRTLESLLTPVRDFINVKFMKLKSDDEKKSVSEEEFFRTLNKTHLQNSIRTKIEYYNSPGEDIGSSCGQFFT